VLGKLGMCAKIVHVHHTPKDKSPGKFSWLTKVDLRVHPNPWHCAPLQMFGPPQGACMDN